jgi:hypothetical protein
MIKKCILLTAIILLLVSCKRNSNSKSNSNSNSNSKRKSGAEIIFWDYSEDFVQEGISEVSNVNELKSKYNLLATLSFDEFKYFDSVKKAFAFKDPSKQDSLFTLMAQKTDLSKSAGYFFSVVKDNKIIMQGLNRLIPPLEASDIEKHFSNKIIFDADGNLRIVKNRLFLEGGDYGVEIIHTEEIEKLLPDCKHEVPARARLVKDKNYYYLILDDKNFVLNLDMDGKTILDCSIKADNIDADMYQKNDGDYAFKIDFPNYHEFTYTCKAKNKDDIAFFTDMVWNKELSYGIKMYQGGTVEERK